MAIKLIQPAERLIPIKDGAFLLNPANLTQLQVALDALVGQPLSWRYALLTKQSVKYEADDFNDIGTLPLDDKKERQEFIVESSLSGEVIFRVRFTYPQPKTSANSKEPSYNIAYATISGAYHSHATVVASIIENMRPWYNNILMRYSIVPFILGIFISVGTVLALGKKVSDEGTILLIAVAVLGLLGTVLPYMIFDPLVVSFGKEAERQEAHMRARRWVFGTFFASLLLMAAGEGIKIALGR
ncbi:MAG TPA: hypothetical protein VGF71_08130 [Caulobacteraceae bacterium]|jgi:hypothetical protein